MDEQQFSRLMESARQAEKHATGKLDLRTTRLPPPPTAMGKTEVVRIRESLNFSQAVFATYLNVSVKTVQSWEQGINKPSGASLKLLSIIRRKPSLLIELSA